MEIVAKKRRAAGMRLNGISGLIVVGVAVVAVGLGAGLLAERRSANPFADIRNIDPGVADAGVARIEAEWRPESAVMTLEVIPFVMHVGHEQKLYDLLRRKTGQSFADGRRDEWYRWLWDQPAPDAGVLNRWRHQFYSANSGYPLGSLAGYFADDPTTVVRADEVRWGGVLRDGIIPVRQPVMVPADEATYLTPTDLVFGLRVNGDARAYPRRVLGHHEMVCDTAGGVPVTGVYCPLCENMIAYRNRTADGATHTFGTSGFLYRSNKLMYDQATLSLWSTFTGRPVVGKLAGTAARLDMLPVVTTTWGEWKLAHPDTRVLSLDGLPNPLSEGKLDYSEGAAYRRYFATDQLMFAVPTADDRLRNKDEVFVPRPPADHPPVALSVALLASRPVYAVRVGDANLLVVTTPGGANRAYGVGGRAFADALDGDRVTDADGKVWRVTEEALAADGEAPLPRVPGHRAFWFGWQAAHPVAELVK